MPWASTDDMDQTNYSNQINEHLLICSTSATFSKKH